MYLLPFKYLFPLKFLQVYAPAIASDNDEVEKVNMKLKLTLVFKSTSTVLKGDFNAKLGKGGIVALVCGCISEHQGPYRALHCGARQSRGS